AHQVGGAVLVLRDLDAELAQLRAAVTDLTVHDEQATARGVAADAEQPQREHHLAAFLSTRARDAVEPADFAREAVEVADAVEGPLADRDSGERAGGDGDEPERGGRATGGDCLDLEAGGGLDGTLSRGQLTDGGFRAGTAQQ